MPTPDGDRPTAVLGAGASIRALEGSEATRLRPVLEALAPGTNPDRVRRFVDLALGRTYDAYLLDGPRRLVLKRAAAGEVEVHRRHLHDRALPVPELLGAAWVGDEQWFLMSYAAGVELHRCDLAGARAAGRALGRLQAPWWSSSAPVAPPERWRRELEHCRCLVGAWPVLPRALDLLAELRARQSWTLVQGDLHPLNVLVDRGVEPARATVIDWALGGIGPWCSDAARFLAFSAPSGALHQLDEGGREAFLEAWCACLLERGVDPADLRGRDRALTAELCLQQARHLCWTLERPEAPRDEAFELTLARAEGLARRALG